MADEGVSADIDGLLHDHFSSVAERDHVPGIAYGLVREGALSHVGGVGSTRIDATILPTAVTPSRIASMTKSFTAAGVLMLRDEQALSLDVPIATYVPELARLTPPTADSPDVTIRHLLSMGAGLPEDNAWADRHLQVSRADVDEMFASGATFSRAPGVAYEYSNYGWVMLGRVIDAVTGRPAQRFLTERLLEPLGLTDTTWDVPGGDRMVGYRWRDDAWLWEGDPLPDGSFGPIGGLWSTVVDIGAWIGFLLDAFPPRDDDDAGPLGRASRREMQQVHRAEISTLDSGSGRLTAGGYGFGSVVTHDLRFGSIVEHGGGLPGYASRMTWLPSRQVGVVVLTNLTGQRTGISAIEALELLDDAGAIPPVPMPIAPDLRTACEELVGLLHGWDDDRADTLFSPNVPLDDPYDRRRATAERLIEIHGPLSIDAIEATSATTGTIRLVGRNGEVTIEVERSPAVPSGLQRYEVDEGSLSPPAPAGSPDEA